MKTPYHDQAAAAGKVFFDGPEGSMVCSATVVKDPTNPGKSNMVWTAGHCVHAGARGRLVPQHRLRAVVQRQRAWTPRTWRSAPKEQVAPYGVWWGDWAQTSDQWIEQGGRDGRRGRSVRLRGDPCDPGEGQRRQVPGGDGRLGAAGGLRRAGRARRSTDITATGYPAAPPFDGQKHVPVRRQAGPAVDQRHDPTMYRIGCTMTGGSSGGGWVAQGQDGKPALVSNTSIGPVTAGWLAGPRLGEEAEGVYDAVSKKFARPLAVSAAAQCGGAQSSCAAHADVMRGRCDARRASGGGTTA